MVENKCEDTVIVLAQVHLHSSQMWSTKGFLEPAEAKNGNM